MIATKQIQLDPQRHELALNVIAKKTRAAEDEKKLTKIAEESNEEAKAARLELGKAELAVSLDQAPEVDPADALARLQKAEARAVAARAEAERRRAVAGDLEAEYREALVLASSEIAEAVAPQIRELTREWAEAAAKAHGIAEELERIYRDLSQGRERLYTKYQVHGPQPPHESLVLKFRSDPSHGSYAQAMQRHFENAKKHGYEL